jgi:dihydropteroate synthase
MKAGRLPTALLLTGAPGVGKQRLALWIAAGLVCEQGPGEPCGACHACHMASGLSHPDIHWFFPIARPKGEDDKQADEAEELRRVVPVVRRVVEETGLPVSVDTRHSRVAEAALAAGAEIVNDVSGLEHDRRMVEVVRASGAGVVIMHMRGDTETMDSLARYRDVAAEVAAELAQRRDRALEAGVAREAIVLDPGLGFAKAPEHNLAVLNRLGSIVALGHPVMVGPSRKRFLGAVTGRPVEQRDAATAAACAVARIKGARLFRVHDVAAAREALSVADAVADA